ncbi:DNA helicase II [Candidatus Hartigia pinicola]
MNVSDLIEGLNSKQYEAVSAPLSNLLVLAGAGSGKTRVLVHRIAWLMSVEYVSPFSIMAVTFTNKAAEKMRNRIKKLIGSRQDDMWIGTFHSLAYRLLRQHYIDANLPKYFQILDSDDQYQLIRRLLKMMNLKEKQWSPRQGMWYINNKKDKGLRPQNVESNNHPINITWLKLYEVYQESCDRSGLVDFSEILLRAHELWLNKPDILQHYRERFTNILVDEFQDTNRIQYTWIRMLAGETGKVMIVGDDDQSIYSWRGAQIENIQRFLNDFPGAKTIRLEQNYRSTNNILKAANELIANNSDRLGKELWTEDSDGELISLHCAINELDEAHYIVSCIQKWKKNGGMLQDCAMLYRSNAQSRILEEVLIQSALPYHIYGGQRFFERQEIKDTLSYLKLIINRDDDASFERIINRPPRGIGDRTLDIVRQTARDHELTLWESCKYLLRKHILKGRTEAIQHFLQLIDKLSRETRAMPLYIQTNEIINKSGLRTMYEQEKNKKSQGRIENLEELVNATRDFSYPNKDQNFMALQAFLSHIVLEDNVNNININQDAVQLMTLHSAKGLEFQSVFIIGMEEGLFPSHLSINESGFLEEERRLAYVGITRAIQKLTITYTESRRLYGKEVYNHPSRFIAELPNECIKKTHLREIVLSSYKDRGTTKTMKHNYPTYVLGQRVRHFKFGEGTIIDLEGSGEKHRLKIMFQKEGVRWLVASYARLQDI